MYFLRLFGNLLLEGPSGPLPSRVVPRRRLALLALLASGEDAGLSRTKLIGILWPDRPDQRARHLLADAAYRLRKALGAMAITSDGDILRLNPAVIQVDAQAFKAALAADDLRAAIELYRGPYLDGFYLPDAPQEFERWLDTERARFKSEVGEAFESLADHAEAGGEFVQAVDWWRRLMDEDPFNSRVGVRLMRALAEAGDAANALRFARAHECFLREELGVEPPLELRALTERLRTVPEPGRGPPHLPSRVVTPGPPFGVLRRRSPVEQHPTVFVSRDEELERLTGFLQDVLAGRGRVGFVTGEAGTGKTSLVEEFGRRAMVAHGDLVVATGHCNAHTGQGDPYLPFKNILHLLTGDVEARWAAGSLSSAHAKRLWSLFPVTASALAAEGRDLVGTLVSAQDLLERASVYGEASGSGQLNLPKFTRSLDEPAGDVPTRTGLFDQYARVLRAVARERPLVLVLDDLQWADAGSIDLLFQLGRELHGSRILILGLFRPSEVALGRNSERHPLEPVINELGREYGDILVSLPEEGSRHFTDALVDASSNRLGEEFRDKLFGLTRGHALFAVELLQSMKEQGTLTLDAEGRWRHDGEVVWRAIPTRVNAVIAERIGRLPREHQRVLTVASVEGEWFTLEAVAELLGSSVENLLPVVADEMERRHHLVRAEGIRQTGGRTHSQYRFGHFLFQQYLYGQLDPVERAHLHARFGAALERLHGDQADEVALSLARHFTEGGVTEKAAAYLHEAGEQAKRAAAYPEAVAHFRKAVELLQTLPESEERDRTELREQISLGSIWFGVEDHGLSEAEGAYRRARELAERVGERAHLFWILLGLHLVSHFQGRQDTARELLGESLALAEAEGDGALVVMTHYFLGGNALNRGRPTEALAHFSRSCALYDPAEHRPPLLGFMGDPELCTAAESGLVLWSLGYPDEATERVVGAVRGAEVMGHSVTLFMALLDEVFLRMWLREPEALSRQNEALRTLVVDRGMPQMLTLTDFYRGWCLSQEGNLEEGRALMEVSLAGLDAQHWAVWRPLWAALLADVHRRAGRPERGLEVVEPGLATVEKTGERIHKAEQHRIRGELLLALPVPDSAKAEQALRLALEVAREQEAKSYELRAAMSLARLLRGTGRPKEGRRILSHVFGWFTQGFGTADLIEAKGLLEELDQSI